MKHIHPLARLARKLSATPEVAATIGPVYDRMLRPEPGRGLAALFTLPRTKFVPVKLPPKFLAQRVTGPPFAPAPLSR